MRVFPFRKLTDETPKGEKAAFTFQLVFVDGTIQVVLGFHRRIISIPRGTTNPLLS